MGTQYYQAVYEPTGEVIASKLTLAQRYASRAIGLLGKRSISENEGVILTPCWSIHMFFMRFSIDVLFLDEEGRILKAIKKLRPWAMAHALGAKSVIEVRAGRLEKMEIKIGQKALVLKSILL